MSESCGNPDCPVHGNGPEAIKDRELRARVVTNEELMRVIRVRAVNVHNKILWDAGIPSGPLERNIQYEILRAAMDRDPVVQGLIDAEVVMLRDHYPTQQFSGLCFAVPESENFLTKKLGKPIEDVRGDLVGDVPTFKDLMELLRGLGRR